MFLEKVKRSTFLLLGALMTTMTLSASCEPANNLNKPAIANPTISDSASTVAEVKKFINDFGAAMSKNDVFVLDKMWADDFAFVSHDGEIFSKVQLLEVLKSGTEKFELVAFDNIDVRSYGDTAVVIASGKQKATLAGKDHSGSTVVSIVVVKSKDGWRMVSAHLSELKAEAKTRN